MSEDTDRAAVSLENSEKQWGGWNQKEIILSHLF